MSGPIIPLAGWANQALNRLAHVSASKRIRTLSGEGLLGERAYLNRFLVPGRRSAGGGCRLFETKDGAVALNLARPDDRGLLPALFCSESLDPEDEAGVAAELRQCETAWLVARGRELGLAVASALDLEERIAPAVQRRSSTVAQHPPEGPPLVVDMSSLWAGPLAGHLLWLAGAEVIKVESPKRPDAMRDGDARLFDLLNQGKRSVHLDIHDQADREALVSLLARADIIIESSRPRALAQVGIEADWIASRKPGRVWMSITGHGGEGEAGQWVGFGDDCAVAGGLTAALFRLTGRTAFVGDAIADPLAGIGAASVAYEAYRTAKGGRYFLSMSGIAALALDEEMRRDAASVASEMASWADARGRPFGSAPGRPVTHVPPPGRDTRVVLAELAAC